VQHVRLPALKKEQGRDEETGQHKEDLDAHEAEGGDLADERMGVRLGLKEVVKEDSERSYAAKPVELYEVGQLFAFGNGHLTYISVRGKTPARFTPTVP
jgi:hypothetical protein